VAAFANPIAFVLKNDLAEIARLSESVDEIGRNHGIAAEVLYAVNLALDEILTNVISYGYAESGERVIQVRLTIAAGELVAEIEDDACPFNPLEAPAPEVNAPLQEKPLGGLGIHLARTMTDGMAYRRENGKNILTFRKKFAVAQGR
jgi:anti-sigma regulatory factor (Ser/Thr protein kinase)